MKQRSILYFLASTGFLVTFVHRTDINIAMARMVSKQHRVSGRSTDVCNDESEDIISNDNAFNWTVIEECLVISCYYWSYTISQTFGGKTTRIMGSKLVFGGAQIASSISKFLFPRLSKFSVYYAIGLRLFEGFAAGFTWPAMYALVYIWYPPDERLKFIASFQTTNLGVGLTYIIYGALITYFHWQVTFYVSGFLGFFWCIGWFICASDTPETNRFIKQEELQYILANTEGKIPLFVAIPWLHIIISIPVWTVIITNFGRTWLQYMFFLYLPLYINDVFNYSMVIDGLVSGLPFLLSFVTTVITVLITGYLIRNKVIPLVYIRKIITAISQVASAGFLMAVTYSGCDTVKILSYMYASICCVAIFLVGAQGSIYDLAPNYSSEILIFSQFIQMSPTYLLPILVSRFISSGGSLDNWNNIFICTSAISAGTFLPYLFLGTSEVQDWNFYGTWDAERVAPVAMELVKRHEKARRIPKKTHKPDTSSELTDPYSEEEGKRTFRPRPPSEVSVKTVGKKY